MTREGGPYQETSLLAEMLTCERTGAYLTQTSNKVDSKCHQHSEGSQERESIYNNRTTEAKRTESGSQPKGFQPRATQQRRSSHAKKHNGDKFIWLLLPLLVVPMLLKNSTTCSYMGPVRRHLLYPLPTSFLSDTHCRKADSSLVHQPMAEHFSTPPHLTCSHRTLSVR